MVIGFRSFPDGFSYVVLNGLQSSPEVKDHDRLSLPQGYSWPEKLSWIRKQISEILNKHDVCAACIKTIEPSAKKKSKERIQIEGIIQEYLFSNKSLRCNTRIKSQLKRDIQEFSEPARYLERVLSESDKLSSLNTPGFREATLAAVSELPIE